MGERTRLLFKDQWTAGLCFNLCSNLCSKLSNQWFPVRATCTITHLCPVHFQAVYLSLIGSSLVIFVTMHGQYSHCSCPQPVLSYIVPARSSHHGQQCYHRFNGNHSSGNPLHRNLAPNMDSLCVYQPFKYWIYTREIETSFVGWTDLLMYTQHKQQQLYNN